MSSTTRADPTLAGIPVDLKKRIALALSEIEDEPFHDHDDCASCASHEEADENKSDGPLDGMKDVQKELEHLSQPVASSLQNLGNLRLVNQEWNGICSPFIFQTPDIVERSTESLLYFYRNILPRHAEAVESLFLMQTVERMTEDEDSQFKMFDNLNDSEREAKVLEAVEAIAQVPASENHQVRVSRSRSLIVGEIIKASPKLNKVDFDGLTLEEDQAPHPDLKDYIVEAVRAHRSTYNTITHLGYSLTPDAVGNFEDVASLLAPYASTLKSLRLECFSVEGDKKVLTDALRSLTALESLDLGESDFVDDSFAEIDFSWPLKELTLGEYLDLSFPSFVKFVERFSSTLTSLELDGTPYPSEEDEAKNVEDLKTKVNLPKLEIVEIATNHEATILDTLATTAISLREVRIGFCPNFDVDDVVKFLEKKRETLVDFELDIATFSEEEMDKLKAVCEELEIGFMVVAGGMEDFLGGGTDEEWEDDDDEEEEDE